MSSAEDNSGIDEDIVKCKKDILRARDVIPSFKPQTVPAEPEGGAVDLTRAEVPKFDLAEDIMANQRKVTSEKRLGPGKKPVAKSGVSKASAGVGAAGKSKLYSPEQDKIIAEIVARDIAKMYW